MMGGGGGRWPLLLEREVGERPPVVCRLVRSPGVGGEELRNLAGSVHGGPDCSMEVELGGHVGGGLAVGSCRPSSPDAGDASCRLAHDGSTVDACMDSAVEFCRARMGLPAEDVCMDGCPLSPSLRGGSAMEVGEVGNGFNVAMLQEDAVLGPSFVNNTGNSHGPPQSGQFIMGSRQAFASVGAPCLQGVCSYAPTRDSALGPSGACPNNSHVKAGPAKSAWNRPVNVLLPGRKDLGMAASSDDRVHLDVDEVLSTIKRFDRALVGRLFGRKLNFDFLDSELHRRWNGFGNFRLITMSGNCFICFFDTLESRDAVLLGGPWIVAGQVVGVDSWSPSFSPSSHAGFITPVWVRIPGLPLYCWGARNIARIVCQLGEPVSMDAATDRLERGQFARVCVRLDLSKPLRPGMWIDGPYGSFFQQVEYEGLSSFCYLCGHVGHKANWCKNKQAAGAPPTGAVAHEELGKKGQGLLLQRGVML